MLKVAIVHEMLVKLGGAERVVKVLADMYPDSQIFTLFYDAKKCGEVFPPERVQTSFLQKYVNLGIPYQLLLGKMPLAIESFDFTGYDLVISSSSAFAHGIITNLETKHLCYCHSPMRYAWDYTHEYRREKGGKLIQFWINWVLHKIRLWDQAAVDRVDVYLANSQNVQKRIQKYYHTAAQIVYPPVEIERFTVSKQQQRYFLIVSALTSFKQIDLAIKAFNQTQERLIIIGDGQEKARLQKMAGPRIEILGRKSDAEVTEYLQNCQALIFPGEEDFGITPVEAMACGKPVLGYAKGGLLETVIPGKTGELFEALTVEAFLSGLERLKQNYQNYQPEEIRRNAEKFSVADFKAQISAIITEILN